MFWGKFILFQDSFYITSRFDVETSQALLYREATVLSIGPSTFCQSPIQVPSIRKRFIIRPIIITQEGTHIEKKISGYPIEFTFYAKLPCWIKTEGNVRRRRERLHWSFSRFTSSIWWECSGSVRTRDSPLKWSLHWPCYSIGHSEEIECRKEFCIVSVSER